MDGFARIKKVNKQYNCSRKKEITMGCSPCVCLYTNNRVIAVCDVIF